MSTRPEGLAILRKVGVLIDSVTREGEIDPEDPSVKRVTASEKDLIPVTSWVFPINLGMAFYCQTYEYVENSPRGRGYFVAAQIILGGVPLNRWLLLAAFLLERNGQLVGPLKLGVTDEGYAAVLCRIDVESMPLDFIEEYLRSLFCVAVDIFHELRSEVGLVSLSEREKLKQMAA